MAITTKSVDSIVRETLIEAGLPLHFYIKFLYYGLKEVDRLARKHKMNVKHTTLTVTSYKRAALPSDCDTVIGVSIQDEERLESLPRDPVLNKQYNLNSSGEKIAWPSDPDSGYVYVDNLGQTILTEGRLVSGRGGIRGLSTSPNLRWDIDYQNQELVFSNDVTNAKTFVLIYVPTTINSTSQNVVVHHFVETVRTFIHWQRHLHNRSPMNVIESARREYRNAKRVMESWVHPFSYADLLMEIRRGYFASPKYP